MLVTGYEFHNTIVDIPVGGARYPAIYQAAEARGFSATHGIAFDKMLLPEDVRVDVYKQADRELASAKSGGAPLVLCADMPWLIQRLEEVRVSNRPSDWVFTQHALRLVIAAVPLRWIANGTSRYKPNYSLDHETTLLLESVEIFKGES